MTVGICLAMAVLSFGCSRKPYLWDAADTVDWLSRDPGRKLANLSVGDEVAIEYNAYGCFSEHHFRLQIRGGTPVEVAVYEVDWTKKPRDERHMGTMAITADQIARLDRALSIYRARTACVHSGYTELRVSWIINGRRKASEKLEAEYCGPFEEVDLLHLGELISWLDGDDT